MGSSEEFFKDFAEGLSNKYGLTEEEINQLKPSDTPIMYLIQANTFRVMVDDLSSDNSKFAQIQEDISARGRGGATQLVSELSGFDAVHYEESDVWVVYEPKQIKSAEVTRDDFGDIIPLSQRFDEGPRLLRTRYGAESYIPPSLDGGKLDLSGFVDTLEVSLFETGTYKQPSKLWEKLTTGSVDPAVRRFKDERDQFVKETQDLVLNWKKKHDRILAKNPQVTPELISKASGSRLGSQLSSEQEQEVNDTLLAELAEARKIEDPDERELAFKAAKARRKKRTREIRQENWDSRIAERDQAIEELVRLSPEMWAVVRDVRKLIDTLSAKGKKIFGQSEYDIDIAFDGNFGLYITRKYRMFEDNDFARAVREDPDYEQTRIDAINFFSNLYYKSRVSAYTQQGLSKMDAEARVNEEIDEGAWDQQTEGRKMMEEFIKS